MPESKSSNPETFTNIYSYDHNTTPNPSPTDSTGEGYIGTNVIIDGKKELFVDGDVDLGDDGAGTEAVLKNNKVIAAGTVGDVERIDPDPLGIVGGEYAQKMDYYRTNNDNAAAGVGTALIIGANATVTLGPGNYYFTDLIIEANGKLNINNSAGPVNIWLDGGQFDFQKNSIPAFSGKPVNFALFANTT